MIQAKRRDSQHALVTNMIKGRWEPAEVLKVRDSAGNKLKDTALQQLAESVMGSTPGRVSPSTSAAMIMRKRRSLLPHRKGQRNEDALPEGTIGAAAGAPVLTVQLIKAGLPDPASRLYQRPP